MELFAAKEASYEFLTKKMGDELATMMIESAARGDKRWTLKYMAFGAIILKYRRQLDMACSRVISLGDGQEEASALKEYATEHEIQCIHFGFLKWPTIEQLQAQWVVVEREFTKLVSAETKGSDQFCTIHEMSALSKVDVDNTRHFNGVKQQLPALNSYLQLWLSLVQ